MKKLIAFDMDGTLAPSKSAMPGRQVHLFNELLKRYDVCIISGAKYEVLQYQATSRITTDPALLARLHVMPTSGTRYYTFDTALADWKLNYAEDFTPEQKQTIITALAEGMEKSGHTVDKTYGETIEDRESQITLSIMGQDIVAELGDEGVRIKEEWDPTGEKKLAIRNLIAPMIPDFEVRAAGATSIDVTKPGVDKAYGINRLMEYTGFAKEDILFMGDKIIDGGNDYPVQQMGVDCIRVRNWEDTSYAVEGLLAVS